MFIDKPTDYVKHWSRLGNMLNDNKNDATNILSREIVWLVILDTEVICKFKILGIDVQTKFLNIYCNSLHGTVFRT
jgi:hypothetical protein